MGGLHIMIKLMIFFFLPEFFDLKMKYDESDNAVVRASRAVTEKVSYLFGKYFNPFSHIDAF